MYVHVDAEVDVDDVLSQLDDDDLLKIAKRVLKDRMPEPDASAMNLIHEAYADLIVGRTADAIALLGRALFNPLTDKERERLLTEYKTCPRKQLS